MEIDSEGFAQRFCASINHIALDLATTGSCSFVIFVLQQVTRLVKQRQCFLSGALKRFRLYSCEKSPNCPLRESSVFQCSCLAAIPSEIVLVRMNRTVSNFPFEVNPQPLNYTLAFVLKVCPTRYKQQLP